MKSGSTALSPRSESATRIGAARVALLLEAQPSDGAAPKAMAEIGGKPLLWHNLMSFAAQGFGEFLVTLGGRWHEQARQAVFDFVESARVEECAVAFADAGAGIEPLRRPSLRQRTVVWSRGDSLFDIDVPELLHFHIRHGRLATAVAVRPPARFGKLQLDGDRIVEFAEKPQQDEGWINSGLCIFEPAAFDYARLGETVECQLLERLAQAGELMAYQHAAFWQRADTLRDQRELEALWQGGRAPWKCWD
jgi:glucose-1-phosphate cytidylyltransferase